MSAIRCYTCHNDNYSDGTYCIFCGANLKQSNKKRVERKVTQNKRHYQKLLSWLRWIALIISLAPGIYIFVLGMTDPSCTSGGEFAILTAGLTILFTSGLLLPGGSHCWVDQYPS